NDIPHYSTETLQRGVNDIPHYSTETLQRGVNDIPHYSTETLQRGVNDIPHYSTETRQRGVNDIPHYSTETLQRGRPKAEDVEMTKGVGAASTTHLLHLRAKCFTMKNQAPFKFVQFHTK
uniref:Uncharacterized protein n=1 Tax=Esox lucius TaxID=8010 RepID=A0A6Q2Z9M6_ESOLU